MLDFAPVQLSEEWRHTLFTSAANAMDIHDTQLYSPLHERFFNMTAESRLDTTVSPNRHLLSITGDDTAVVAATKDGAWQTQAPVHFKLCPLVDPLDFLVGKTEAVEQALELPVPDTQRPSGRANSSHNRAYTDAFFVYLSSRLLHNHGLTNALDYYGTFNGIKQDYRCNIADDLDELWESDSFLGGIDERFILDADPLREAFLALRDNSLPDDEKPLLQIGDSQPSHADLGIIDVLGPEGLRLVPISPQTTPNAPPPAIEPYDFPSYDTVNQLQHPPSSTNHTSHLDPNPGGDSESEGGDSNRTSVTTAESEGAGIHLRRDRGGVDRRGPASGEDSNDGESETDSEDSEESHLEDHPEGAWCTIPAIAVSVLAQERLEGTLQDLIDDDEGLSEAEWRSCLFQVIATLHAYNTAYGFVHNDLHAANIMYRSTKEANILYRHGGHVYRVPTYGRCFKIIDFGRATYRFGGLNFLNDCYENDNDAANQYNYDRLLKRDEPPCTPNASFDLCRLACGLYDYFDAIGEYSDEGSPSGVAAMIDAWCHDDEGRNMLYKSSGVERYPGFKLYRMIARKVTQHVPSTVLNDQWFATYRIHAKRAKKLKASVIDLDAIKPEYYVPQPAPSLTSVAADTV